MKLWLTLVVVLVGVSILLCTRCQSFDLDRPDASQNVNHTEPLEQSAAPARLPMDGPVVVREQEATTKEQPGTAAPDTDFADRLRAARHHGVLDTEDIRFVSRDAWDGFAKVWDETTRIVLDAENQRRKIGSSIAKRRLADGNHQTILLEERDRGKDGGFSGKWEKLNHPDEWLTLRYKYRPGGGQIIEVVRLMPGDDQQLDEATMNLTLTRELRRDAVTNFVKSHLPTAHVAKEK